MEQKFLKNRFELVLKAFPDMILEDKFNTKVKKLRLTYPKLELSLFISVPEQKVADNENRKHVTINANDTYYIVEYRKQIKQEGVRISGAQLIGLIADYESREFYATYNETYAEHREKLRQYQKAQNQ